MPRTSTTFSAGDARAKAAGARGGRTPLPDDIVALAREYTRPALETLIEINCDKKAPPAARVRAAEIILNRGWGPSSPAPHTDVNIYQPQVLVLHHGTGDPLPTISRN